MFMRAREGYFGVYFSSYTAARRAHTTTTIIINFDTFIVTLIFDHSLTATCDFCASVGESRK